MMDTDGFFDFDALRAEPPTRHARDVKPLDWSDMESVKAAFAQTASILRSFAHERFDDLLCEDGEAMAMKASLVGGRLEFLCAKQVLEDPAPDGWIRVPSAGRPGDCAANAQAIDNHSRDEHFGRFAAAKARQPYDPAIHGPHPLGPGEAMAIARGMRADLWAFDAAGGAGDCAFGHVFKAAHGVDVEIALERTRAIQARAEIAREERIAQQPRRLWRAI